MKPHEIQRLPLIDLKPSPYNPRRITREAMKGLTASVKRFGLVQPIVVNKRSGFVVGGHQRIEALKASGETEAAVVFVDLNEQEEKALNVALNSPAIAGQFTDDLQKILADLREAIPHDFVDLRLDELLADLKVTVAPDDDIPEPSKNPVAKVGDIWMLGYHTVICGDSTDIKTAQTVQQIGFANLLFTSPPYWVGKSYEYQKSEDEITAFIDNVCRIMAACIQKDNSRIIINTGTGNNGQFTKKVETLLLLDKWVNFLRRHGWLMRHLRIWVKSGGLPAAVSPRNDFIDQHSEFIGTFYHSEGKNRGQNRINEQWVQQGFIDDIKGRATELGHTASFPVELPHRFIRLYSKPGEYVLDVFGGSGTTLIACEQTKRRAILVERDPAYVDITIKRWQKFTGGKADKKKTLQVHQ